MLCFCYIGDSKGNNRWSVGGRMYIYTYSSDEMNGCGAVMIVWRKRKRAPVSAIEEVKAQSWNVVCRWVVNIYDLICMFGSCGK